VAYLEVISTDCIEPARQRPFWQAALKDKLGLASRFDGNGSLIAKLECALFRDVGIFRLTGSGYHVERTPGLITSSALGFVKVALQLSGSTKFLQGSRQVVLSSGEWTIFDNSRPYQSSNPGPVQLIVLTLPVHRLRSHRFDLDKMMLLKFSNIAGMSRLTYGLIESVFDQFEALGKKHYADLADVICHMLHMNLLEENDKLPLHSSREYLNEKFKRYILHNLRNPDLNVDRIAEDLGVQGAIYTKLLRMNRSPFPSTCGTSGWTVAEWSLRQNLTDRLQKLLSNSASAAHRTSARNSRRDLG